MKAKATKETVDARVADVLRIRLDGAQFFQIREYVREMEAKGEGPWAIPEGAKPLSDSQLRRYSQRADRHMAEASRASRGKLLREHVSRRLNLYARATQKGDERTALAVLRDVAEIQGLYPPKGVQLTGRRGAPVVLRITEEIVGGRPANPIGDILEEIVSSDGSGTRTGPDGSPSPGPT